MVLSATFRHGNREGLAYGRDRNPTWELLEAQVADLEGGRGAVSFASGMAAVSAALDLVPLGAEVAVGEAAYTGTRELLNELESAGRLRVRKLDMTSARAALELPAEVALVWMETLGNPLLSVPDLDLWSEEAHRRGAIVVVDNTFATPLLCQPLSHGADLVLHSVSKYLGGHSDLMLGIVAARDEELLESARRVRTHHGGCPGQMEAWLALRGLRTLDVRLRRQVASAGRIAAALQRTPGVARVHYPGLPDHPQHQLASRMLQGGFGAMLALVLDVSAEEAERVCEAATLFTNATSLGSVDSLLERRQRWSGEEHLPPGLIRVSVGIEAVEDLLADLSQALAVVGTGPLPA